MFVCLCAVRSSQLAGVWVLVNNPARNARGDRRLVHGCERGPAQLDETGIRGKTGTRYRSWGRYGEGWEGRGEGNGHENTPCITLSELIPDYDCTNCH